MNTYNIAGIYVHMDVGGRTLKQAEQYRVDDREETDIRIYHNAERLQATHPHLSLDDCEYISSATSFYNQLIRFQGIMLHSCCVVVDDRAYLFSAPSGTGKSTHVQLWLELLGDRAYVLNDDKPALRIIDGKVYAYGTPWSGKYDCSRNACVPVGGIAVLKRAEDNSIRSLSPTEALFPILNQTNRPKTGYLMSLCLENINAILPKVPVYELSCNMDISAARLSYETMSKKEVSSR